MVFAHGVQFNCKPVYKSCLVMPPIIECLFEFIFRHPPTAGANKSTCGQKAHLCSTVPAAQAEAMSAGHMLSCQDVLCFASVDSLLETAGPHLTHGHHLDQVSSLICATPYSFTDTATASLAWCWTSPSVISRCGSFVILSNALLPLMKT